MLHLQEILMRDSVTNVPKVFPQHGLITNSSERAHTATFTRNEDVPVFQDEHRGRSEITTLVDAIPGAL